MTNFEQITAAGAFGAAAVGYGMLKQSVTDIRRRLDLMEPIIQRLGGSWLFREEAAINPLSDIDAHRMNRAMQDPKKDVG